MNHRDFTYWIATLTLALIGCWTMRAIDLWFTPSEVPQVELEQYVPPSKGVSYKDVPSLAGRVEWCKYSEECAAMAEALVYEARSEPMAGAVAVGFVILERMKSERWPDTVKQVVHYRCQFSYTCQRKQRSVPTEKDWTRAYQASYDVLNGKAVTGAKGADHYFNPKKVRRTPSWALKYEYVAKIGDHRFYKSREGM